MIKVDLHNYESFAIDYIEGELDGDKLSAFILFLENHPEIKDEIDSLKSEVTGFESIAEFENKTGLKKEALLSDDINTDNYQTYFVAFYENDLSENTRKKVLEFVKQNADRSKEFESFTKLRFTPDQSIRFPLKQQLKKQTPILALYRGLRVAASIAIILGIAWYFTQKNKADQQYTQRAKPLLIKENPEKESDQITETKAGNIAEQLKDDAVVINKKNNRTEKLPMQNEIIPTKQAPAEREELIAISTTIKSATIEQQFDANLKRNPNWEQIASVAEDKSVFKIKLPKIFRQGNKEESKDEPATIARTKIKISKKDKDPDQKTYVDLGPFKVYKKKGTIANVSNSAGSRSGF